MIVDEKTNRDEHSTLALMMRHDQPVETSRLEKLVTIVDHCTAAKKIAASIDNKFLVYMLDMTIQATRVEMRPKALRSQKKL